MRLSSYHEIVGTLTEIKNEDNKIKLIFNILKEIEIPDSVIPKEKLESLIGYRIGVLNFDGKYNIRRIKRK